MVEIPGGQFQFKVTGTEIEGGNQIGVDVTFSVESGARGVPMSVAWTSSASFIDRTP